MNSKKIIIISVLIAASLLLGGTVYYARYMAERNIEQKIAVTAISGNGQKQNDQQMPLFGIDYSVSEIGGYELIGVEKPIQSSPVDVDFNGYSLIEYKSLFFENVTNPYTGEEEKLYKEFYLRFFPKGQIQTLSAWVNSNTSAVNCRDEVIGSNEYLACEELGITDSEIYYYEAPNGIYEFCLGNLGLNEDTRQALESFQIK